MASGKKVMKFVIIFILLIFLLSTALISVLYLGGNKTDPETGEKIITGDMEISTGVDSMGL